MNLYEWIEKNGCLSETLIITDNVKNVNALIRRINEAGTPVYNLSAKLLVELAKDILYSEAAKEGKIKTFEFISDDIGTYILEKIICEKPDMYTFVPKISMCHRTASEILSNINLIRDNCLNDAAVKQPSKKLSQLLILIDEYEDALKENNLYDKTRCLKEAIAVLKATGSGFVVSHCLLMNGDKLNYLEEQLLNMYAEKVEIIDYQFKQEQVNWSFFRSYGTFNEVDHVISEIIDNKIPFGKVNLIYTSAEYESLISGICAQKNIPVNFISGRSASGLEYIRLIRSILAWADGNYAYQLLKPVFFNRLVSIDGIDADGNKYKINTVREFLKGIDEGIGWGLERYVNFIEAYNAKLSDTEVVPKFGLKKDFVDVLSALCNVFVKLEEAAQKGDVVVSDMLFEITRIADAISQKNSKEKNLIKSALKNEINCLKYRASVNTLHEAIKVICEDLDRIMFSDEESSMAINAITVGRGQVLERPYVYVIGLSDKHYRQAFSESPVLSDEEREEYLDVLKGNVLLGKDMPMRRQKDFEFTLDSLKTGVVHIGYSGYDTIKMEPLSPSAMYLNLLNMNQISKADIKVVDYKNIIEDKIIVKSDEAIDGGEKIDAVPAEVDKNITVRLSASSLDCLYSCPLNYHYSYEQKIEAEEYQVPEVGKWLNPAERGSFVHKVLQDYVSKLFITDDAILADVCVSAYDDVFEKVKEEYEAKCPIDSYSVAKKEMEVISEALLCYLGQLHKEFSSQNNKWKVEGCEVSFKPGTDRTLDRQYRYADGTLSIGFSGCIDRIDSYVDDAGKKHYRLIDYKTGDKNYFKNNKIEGTSQHHIYKMFAEQNGIVDEFLYVFPLMEDTENCTLKVTNFVDPCLINSVPNEMLHQVYFEQQYAFNEDACTYCQYSDICYRNILKMSEDECEE